MTNTRRTPSFAASFAPSEPTPARGWRSFRLFFCCLLGLTAGLSFAHAQDGTGTVTGRVLNATSGKYVANVEVAIAGTSLRAVTNNHGEYVIRNVPVGPISVEASYRGQDPVTASGAVEAGVPAVVNLRIGAAEIGPDNEVILDAYVVETNRFRDAQEIAINAEKQSINIKNVISTEEFGEIPGGNVGEFIKYLPGVELEYGGTYTAPTDATGISIRGFGPEDTAIYIDGVPVTSASQANLTTQVGLDMLSINNASRIELIKVATPDMPMNSVGGQINLISKSAFEYAKPSFSYKVYAVVNSEEPNPFKRVVGATDKKVYAGQPGFELSYIRPVNDNFGFTLTGSRFSQYSANRRLRPEYRIAPLNIDQRPFGGANNTPASNASGPVSASNPFLERVSITDSPRTSVSNSASVRLDYKPFNGLSLAGNYQYSTYDSSDTDRRTQFRIQRPDDWGATYTHSQFYMTAAQSATGSTYNPSNSVSQDITSRDKSGNTHSAYIRATYKKGPWDISALANKSRSRASFHDFENGHFSGVDVSMAVGTVKFDDIEKGIPGRITVYDRTGMELNEVDFTQLANWGNPTIQGKRGNAESKDENTLYQFDLRRELDFIPTDAFQLAFKTGYRYEKTDKVKWGLGTQYRETYIGPTLSSADILDDTYLGTSQGWGFPPQEFVSTYKMYDIYLEDPTNWLEQGTDARENYWSMIGQNKALFETNKAWYALIEGRTLSDRLRFVAGLRDETVTREGYGPQGDGRWNYLKNPDGTLYRNPTVLGTTAGSVRIDQANSKLFTTDAIGNALRADLDAKGIPYRTEPIDPNSLERGQLERRTAPIYGRSEGDPNYSINVSYDISKNLIAKVGYSVSSGRIKIEDATRGLLSGNQNDFRITETENPVTDPDTGESFYTGTISIANPNLLPESSTNWDYAITYYTDSGGKIGASYYTKDLENFTQTFATTQGDPLFPALLETIGLDLESYQQWTINTTENGVGTGKQWGYELEMSQDLRFVPFLGEAGRNIRFFANYSRSERQESNTNRLSSRPTAANLWSSGVMFSARRFSATVRANWRDYVFNGDRASFTLNNVSYGIGEFVPAALKVDVSASYQLTEKMSVYVSARNILEEGNNKQRKDAIGIYPEYARWDDYRDTGVQITFGVSGRF